MTIRPDLKYLVRFIFFLSTLLGGLVSSLFGELEVGVLVLFPWYYGMCWTH